MEELNEIEDPIGKFIIDNGKGNQTENGVYYHYTDVCRLLKLYKEHLQIFATAKSSCGFFENNSQVTSLTACKNCGKEKWQH